MEGRVVLITGASRGIGKALAVGFASAGATVVASARTTQPGSGVAQGSLEETVRQIRDSGGKALHFPCDVASEEQVKALVDSTVAEAGPIDVLINNAGIEVTGSVTELDTAQFENVLKVNVVGPFLLCKYVVPGMMERRAGNIINISSRSAIWDQENTPVYGASKAALDRFTRNLAVDLKPYNIAVNGLGPGLVESEMTRNWDPSLDLWGRMPSPAEEVVPATLWLAQQDASGFTGQVVHRDEFRQTWP